MTAAPNDPYAVLGITPDADQAAINAAFRTLLRRYHPDTRESGDVPADKLSDAALQEVLAAYETLRDPVRRSAHDARSEPHPIRVSRRPRPDEPLLRAGPVHWTPGR